MLVLIGFPLVAVGLVTRSASSTVAAVTIVSGPLLGFVALISYPCASIAPAVTIFLVAVMV